MKIRLLVGTLLATLALVVAAQNTYAASESTNAAGAVYVMSNRANHNSVLVYQRGGDGALSFVQEVPTGGLGTGVTLDPLMSQGALAMRDDGKLLFAVNPVSADVTCFRITGTGLEFASKAPSGGALPVSVTVRNGLVYVLNQLGIANISGFTVTNGGILTPLPNSTRDLTGRALALPAQVSFTPDGSQLIVTEKGTSLIDTFQLLSGGLTNGPITIVSAGKTPFGFDFSSTSQLVVSEAQNRFPLKGSVSSYSLDGGAVTPVSAAVPDRQTAACWVEITGNTAWVVNTGTAVISAYQVSDSGTLTVANSNAAFTGDGSTPIDLAASADGQFLYVLLSATGEIAAFQINGTTLAPLFTQGGLPLTIQGIVAR
jgi:6-phosphogluconolactonase (cycloisomerase 2 family)